MALKYSCPDSNSMCFTQHINLLFSYQLSVISYQRGHFRSNQSAFIF